MCIGQINLHVLCPRGHIEDILEPWIRSQAPFQPHELCTWQQIALPMGKVTSLFIAAKSVRILTFIRALRPWLFYLFTAFILLSFGLQLFLLASRLKL